MFEKATKIKLRFDSTIGKLSVEDLWDLPLQTTKTNGASLDTIARDVYKQIKESDTISFVDDTKNTNEELNLKLEILKHIISVRKEEILAKKAARDNKAMKEQIMNIIATKENENLLSKSVEELKKMMDDLNQ